MKTYKDLMEKTLTPAELKKREEIAKAMEKENPGMNMGKKMAIATAAAKRVAESEELDEAIDKNHPIVKEYEALKKNHDIKSLRSMIRGQGGIVDTSEFKSKDHAISHLLRNKHGNKKVAAAFGLKESEELDECEFVVEGSEIAVDRKTGKVYNPNKELDKLLSQHKAQFQGMAAIEKSQAKKKAPEKQGVAEETMKVEDTMQTTISFKEFQAKLEEAVESIDELKKSTLSSYAKKATSSLAANAWKAGTATTFDPKSQEDLRTKAFAKANKRMAGMNKAVDRLTKEEAKLEEQAPEAPSIGVHRIAVTTSEPDHPAVSKRKETTQRFVRVTANSKERAIEQGKKHFKKKGYKVHGAEHVGVIHEENELDEADYDWSKVGAWGRRTDKGSSIDWNSDKKSSSTDSGTVHKAREVARNPEGGELQKRGRGRPAGEYKGTYKARDPESKAASSAKAQASKADGLAARKEFKTSMDAAIRQRQLEIWKKASKAAK